MVTKVRQIVVLSLTFSGLVSGYNSNIWTTAELTVRSWPEDLRKPTRPTLTSRKNFSLGWLVAGSSLYSDTITTSKETYNTVRLNINTGSDDWLTTWDLLQ